jgi:acyl CoA:acetate/3-ketoacid CoA transferase beta subunit
VIVTMEHTVNGKSKILSECTLPVTAKRCVDRIITDLCVFDVHDHTLKLVELADGVTLDEVRSSTACPFTVAEKLSVFK